MCALWPNLAFQSDRRPPNLRRSGELRPKWWVSDATDCNEQPIHQLPLSLPCNQAA
jgi:hypothetical protein